MVSILPCQGKDAGSIPVTNSIKTKGDFKMNKEAKLLKLKARAVHIKSRGRYLESPGVLKKVNRQIAALEKELNM